MTLDQLNEWINRGYAATGLLLIATALALLLSRRDIEEISKKKSK